MKLKTKIVALLAAIAFIVGCSAASPVVAATYGSVHNSSQSVGTIQVTMATGATAYVPRGGVSAGSVRTIVVRPGECITVLSNGASYCAGALGKYIPMSTLSVLVKRTK